jgi:hypothetical protein
MNCFAIDCSLAQTPCKFSQDMSQRSAWLQTLTDSLVAESEWNASVPWAIIISIAGAIAILSLGGPTEFLYWQF